MQRWIQKIQVKEIKFLAFCFCWVCFSISFVYSQNNKEEFLLDDLDIILELSYQNSFSKTSKIDSLEKYFCKLDMIEDDSTRLRNKFKIINSLVYIKADNLEKLYSYSIKDEALELGNRYNTARAYNYLGDYYLKKFVLDSALYYMNKSEKLFLKEQDSIYLSYCYTSKADIYAHINDYNKALEYNFKALKQAQKTNKGRPIFLAYQGIFMNLGKLKNEKKAFEYYQKALGVLEDHQEELSAYYFSFKAQAHNFMGSVYLKTENYTKAKSLYQKGLSIPDIKNVFPSLYAAMIGNLAYARYKSGDTANVKENLQRALFLKDSLQKPAIAIQTRLRLAEWHSKQKQFEKSKQYAQQAYLDAQEHNIINEELQALTWLAKSDPKDQSAYFEEYIRKKDSLIAQERITRNKFARIEYETQEIEKQNALTQLENEKLTRENIQIAASATIVVLIIGFVYVNYRRKAREKLLVAKQSEQQTKEDIMDLILEQQQQLSQVKQQEQNRISKDLHDDVSSNLSSLHLQMHIFQRKEMRESKPEYQGFMNDLKKLQERVREISHDLNNDREFDQVDFSLAIKGVIQPLQDAGIKTDINYINSFSWSDIPNTVKLELFRILQEAVTNTTKYAEAQTFTVELSKENNLFVMQIQDDGKGFDMDTRSKGIGLKNMKERAKKMNATFSINSEIGEGTLIKLSIPVAEKKKEGIM